MDRTARRQPRHQSRHRPRQQRPLRPPLQTTSSAFIARLTTLQKTGDTRAATSSYGKLVFRAGLWKTNGIGIALDVSVATRRRRHQRPIQPLNSVTRRVGRTAPGARIRAAAERITFKRATQSTTASGRRAVAAKLRSLVSARSAQTHRVRRCWSRQTARPSTQLVRVSGMPITATGLSSGP